MDSPGFQDLGKVLVNRAKVNFGKQAACDRRLVGHNNCR
jgi:hypothetical protein